jgi:precorrin-3B C17-methyltransferase
VARLYIVGIGSKGKDDMTLRAIDAIEKSDVIVGDKTCLKYLGSLADGKEIFPIRMKEGTEGCKYSIGKVKEGKTTSILVYGDSCLYGIAGYALKVSYDIEVEVIPGITTVSFAASKLGAPIMDDFCYINLSDFAVSWEAIEKRIRYASMGNFVIVLYCYKKREKIFYIEKAVEIMLNFKLPSTPVGIVENLDDQDKVIITTLGDINFEEISMDSIIMIGNSKTYIKSGKVITSGEENALTL